MKLVFHHQNRSRLKALIGLATDQESYVNKLHHVISIFYDVDNIDAIFRKFYAGIC